MKPTDAAEQAIEGARLRCAASVAASIARGADALAPPQLPSVTRIKVAPLDNGWAVLARVQLGERLVIVRATYGATRSAAVFRFRYVRREAWIVEEALGPC